VKPFPPASTTPASRRTGKRSGVLATASSAALAACVSNAARSPSGSASIASAVSRTTVRIVPSTGR